jgi:hypothetical protein
MENAAAIGMPAFSMTSQDINNTPNIGRIPAFLAGIRFFFYSISLKI